MHFAAIAMLADKRPKTVRQVCPVLTCDESLFQTTAPILYCRSVSPASSHCIFLMIAAPRPESLSSPGLLARAKKNDRRVHLRTVRLVLMKRMRGNQMAYVIKPHMQWTELDAFWSSPENHACLHLAAIYRPRGLKRVNLLRL